jgi:Lamin Tail Domain/CHU_C Type IX secretion signal domain
MKRFFLFLLVALLSVQYAGAQVANRFDVVIDELFPDPTPQVGLPATEFIELRNVSSVAFNLQNWRISDGTSTATITANFTLRPDSFVIICTNSAVPVFSALGPTIGVTNFPSLDNDGDVIFLRSREGKIIHAVSYTSAWYQNAVKSDGGWTLEMIDTRNPCMGMDNWRASTNPLGGTPGKKNSIDAVATDNTPPQLMRTYTIDSVTVMAVFDESLDSAGAALAANYSFDNGIGVPLSAQPVTPLFQQVQLKLATPLQTSRIYVLTVSNVTDCKANNIGARKTARAGRPVSADSLDMVVNEILFNPKSNGADYAEFYNRSNKVLDAAALFIGNRNTSGAISSLKKLSETPCLIFPGDFITLTGDANNVQQNYLVKNPDWLLTISSMPSFNDDKGNVLLLNEQGKLIDELAYDAKWHFALIDDEEGVSLERIDYNKPTPDKINWHSAASTAGYGTPTQQNSQFRADLAVQGDIVISPKTFSPDNDGFEDFLTINYTFPDPGYVANITIYDAAGRPVRYLAKNALLGIKGVFRWDGLGENNNKLPIGPYVVLVEAFNLQGRKRQFKQVAVLARRLN